MIAEIISVGTELLLGDILNTDVQYLSKLCAGLGFDIYHTSVVGDNDQRLREEIALALSRSDLLLLSGGLGSTADDITKRIAMEFSSSERLEDAATKKIHEVHFHNDPALMAHTKDVYTFPVDAIILRNPVGLSPGAWMPIQYEGQEKVIVVLPGPPSELKGVVALDLLPLLQEKSGTTIRSREVQIGLLGEAKIFDTIRDLAESSMEPSYATYAKEDGVLIRITTQEPDQEKADAILDQGEATLRSRFGAKMLTSSGKKKEVCLVNALEKQHKTIATAESLTGGLLAARIVNVPGASAVFHQGFIVYSDEAKARTLGVDRSLLKEKTAVSREVCQAMIRGLRKQTGADLCLATTGYAGPEGADVGHIFIGLLYGDEEEIYEYHWDNNRARNRDQAVNFAVDHALMRLKEEDYGKGY